ncbi:hypothetical protein [uncultured Ruminococcus sp.]|uniref:hypothetical protein n=1 Tax=uncultured Ruminococcus sp. TaxID=165186 RepID=UPI0025DA129D|nr:hypothetical protein [uncultured Ruminococcus sp.]
MPKYYTINESAARSAHDANSMRDYHNNEKTNEYRAYVDKAYEIGEARKKKYPDEADRIDYLCDKYARKLAEWYNEHFRVEAMCPSILISGAGNFPVHKKEKQNSRRETLRQKWNDIQKIVDRIASCGTDAIKSNDARAIEKLELKIEKLTEEQEMMKAVNAYYRKNKTLDGCPALTEEEIEKIKEEMAKGWNIEDKPFPGWALSNNNANIRRLKERLDKLKTIKEAGTQEHSEDEVGIEGLKIVENTEAMRIQLIFDDKPDDKTRELLKRNGFRWSPRFTAWQRNLNENGKWAARRVIEELKKG